MDARSFCVCLFLLGFLGTSGIAPANGQSPIQLDLDPVEASSFPIDLSALAEQLCSHEMQALCRATGMARCAIVSSNTGSNDPGHPVLPGDGEGNGSDGITVTTLQLRNAGEIRTSCGIWDATVTLDPEPSAPEAPVTLAEPPGDPGFGVFAAIPRMSASIHLENQVTGQTADFTLGVGLSLAGPWVFASGNAPTASSRIFLADREDGQLVRVYTCNLLEALSVPDELKCFVAQGCRLCLGARLP